MQGGVGLHDFWNPMKSLAILDRYFRKEGEVPKDYVWDINEYEGWLRFRWGDGENAIDKVKARRAKEDELKKKAKKQEEPEDWTNFEYDEEHIMINSVILRQEGHTRFLEACKSCKDFVAEVDRPYKIDVEYYNINKVKIKEVLEGFEATVFSHEYDHLNGILHLDLANKILKMSYEERKQYRLNNLYKILTKDGIYNLSK